MALNHAPTGTDSTILIPEDGSRILTISDFGFSDVDGDVLAAVLITSVPAQGTFKLNGITVIAGATVLALPLNLGQLVFTPAANANGANYASLGFRVIDSAAPLSGISLNANTLTFNVTPVNDVPLLTGSIAILPHGTEDQGYVVSKVSLLSGFSDIDGDLLNVVGLVANHGSVLDNGNGTFTITPAANFNGPMTLNYAVSDGIASLAAVQSYVVDAVNDAPLLTGVQPALAHIAEDGSGVVSLASLLGGFSDIEGSALSIAGLAADHGTVLNNGNGTFTITPAANYNGPLSLTYNVSDGLLSTAATQQLVVDAVNDAPVLSGSLAVLAHGTEDTTYIVSKASLLAGFSDIDGDLLSIVGLGASNGTVVDNGDGTFGITPTANFNGPVTLGYSISDGIALLAAAQNYVVDAVNDLPILSGAAAVLPHGTEDTPYIVSAASLLTGFTDIEGNTLSISGLTADHGAVTNNGNGTFSIVPAANYYGPLLLNYLVGDGLGTTAAALGVVIDAVNDLPTGTLTITGQAKQGVTLVAVNNAIADIDGLGPIIYQWERDGTDIANATGLTYQLAQADVGHQISVVASYLDGGGTLEHVTSLLTQTVANVNDAPNGLSLLGGTIPENSPAGTAVGLLSGLDIDGDVLSYALTNSAGGRFIVNPVTGAITVAAGAVLDYETAQSYSIIAKVTDPLGLSFLKTLVINLTNVVENQTWVGTSKADIFIAVSPDNWNLDGGGFKDTLITLAGNDIVHGGQDNDIISTGLGDDVITFRGTFEDYDTVDGGLGDDRIEAQQDGTIIGLHSVVGVETITAAGYSNVSIYGSTINDVLDFSAVTLIGITKINGQGGNDTIVGSATADVIIGGAGNDTLYGMGGDDVFQFSGVSGVDVMDGGSGYNIIEATAAGSVLNWGGYSNIQAISGGGFANVRIVGGAANDTIDLSPFVVTGIALIDGGAGNDRIIGSAGDDVIYGNAGVDTISAGGGNDTIQFSSATTDIIDGGAGFDTLVALAANSTILWTNVSNVEAVSGAGFAAVKILGGAGNDTLDFSGVTLTGIAQVDGGAGNDTIIGSGGNDILYGNAGNDIINAGGGDDTIQFSGATLDTVDGGTGFDTLVALANNSTIVWTGVTNVEAVSAGAFTGVSILGSAANNTLDFSGVTLTNVAIDGAGGNDTILGSAGADRIFGGLGKDIVTGGAGADSYVLRATNESTVGANADRITDFADGSDLIDLSAIDASTAVAGNQAFTFIGSGAFTGVAGELRFDNSTPEVTKIFGDVNGDKISDFEIDLAWQNHTAYALTSSSFVL